jgi:hypothetical protein
VKEIAPTFDPAQTLMVRPHFGKLITISRVHAGKILEYNLQTSKRAKTKTEGLIDWAHTY